MVLAHPSSHVSHCFFRSGSKCDMAAFGVDQPNPFMISRRVGLYPRSAMYATIQSKTSRWRGVIGLVSVVAFMRFP
jgi:hypothetical protein